MYQYLKNTGVFLLVFLLVSISNMTLSNDLCAQSLDKNTSRKVNSKQENRHVHDNESHDKEKNNHEGEDEHPEERADHNEHSEDSTEQHDEHNHRNENQNETVEEGITLSPKKMSLANIQVTSLKPEYQSSYYLCARRG